MLSLIAPLLIGAPQTCPKIGIEGESMVSGHMVVTVTATPDPEGVEMILWEVTGGKLGKQEGLSAGIEAAKGAKVTVKVELAGMTPSSCDPTATQVFTVP